MVSFILFAFPGQCHTVQTGQSTAYFFIFKELILPIYGRFVTFEPSNVPRTHEINPIQLGEEVFSSGLFY